jgi:hypothetical protein
MVMGMTNRMQRSSHMHLAVNGQSETARLVAATCSAPSPRPALRLHIQPWQEWHMHQRLGIVASSHCSSAALSCCLRTLGIGSHQPRYEARCGCMLRGLGCSRLPPWSTVWLDMAGCSYPRLITGLGPVAICICAPKDVGQRLCR